MKIYVGNLNYDITDDELGDTFSNFGNVISAKIITDRETGRAKGFAFVEMQNENEGNSAIAELNGTQLAGRKLIVNEAHARKEYSGNKNNNRSANRNSSSSQRF